MAAIWKMKTLTPPILPMFAQQRVWAWPWSSCHNEKLSSPTFGRSPWEVSCHSRNERNNLCKKWKLKKLWRHNTFCVTLVNFLPLIKRVSQFLIKEKLFLERERGDKSLYHFNFSIKDSSIIYTSNIGNINMIKHWLLFDWFGLFNKSISFDCKSHVQVPLTCVIVSPGRP